MKLVWCWQMNAPSSGAAIDAGGNPVRFAKRAGEGFERSIVSIERDVRDPLAALSKLPCCAFQKEPAPHRSGTLRDQGSKKPEVLGTAVESLPCSRARAIEGFAYQIRQPLGFVLFVALHRRKSNLAIAEAARLIASPKFGRPSDPVLTSGYRMLPAAILVALLMLGTLVTGAYDLTEASLSATGLLENGLHPRTGEWGGAVAIAPLIWIAIKTPRLRKLAFGILAGILVEGLLGHLPNGTSGWGGLLHAVLGQGLLAGAIALVLVSTVSWTRAPQFVQDYGWPSLRSLAFLLPGLVGIQVLLGAAFRQRIMGVMPHIIGAMLVSLFIIMVGSFVLQQCKTHAVLTGTARAMLVTTFVQIFLGIAAYTVRVLPKPEPGATLLIATAHVATGGLLLAATVVMGMQIRRNVTPKKAA